jgi:GNAT superfamily N-acetyltransferase
MSEPVCRADLRELSDLLTAALPHHPITQRRLRAAFFDRPGCDPALARLSRDAGGRIASVVGAALLPGQDGRRRAQLLFMATQPAMQRRGLARELYAEVERELRSRAVRDVYVDSGVLPTGLDLRYQPAATMLLRRLYTPAEVRYDQTLDPDAALCSPRTPPGFAVRPLAPADAAALDAMCEREFPDWKDTSAMISAGPGCGVIGAFAVPSGDLAAFAAYAEYVFGPTGTAATYRRRGLGTAVFWPAVREMLAFTPQVPILIAHANFPFYARAFGCHMRGVVWRMRKDLTCDPAISKGKARPAS